MSSAVAGITLDLGKKKNFFLYVFLFDKKKTVSLHKILYFILAVF